MNLLTATSIHETRNVANEYSIRLHSQIHQLLSRPAPGYPGES